MYVNMQIQICEFKLHPSLLQYIHFLRFLNLCHFILLRHYVALRFGTSTWLGYRSGFLNDRYGIMQKNWRERKLNPTFKRSLTMKTIKGMILVQTFISLNRKIGALLL